MDVREKLVELLEVDLSGSDGYEPELIADYLIAHGVTVQEWVSVKDHTPTEADDKCDRCVWYRNGGCSEWNGMAEEGE